MLQYLGSQRVGHDIVPEQQQLQTRGEIKKKRKKKRLGKIICFTLCKLSGMTLIDKWMEQ